MKDLTTSIDHFENLIRGNFLYVDKTEYVWQLIRPAQEMYFLSRPRRFGKSLLVSTLEAVFEGKRELFKGLALHDKPYDWKKHPVIHLDLSNCGVQTPGDLGKYLTNQLENIADQFKLQLRGDLLATRFENLILDVAKQGGTPVILLDEYDKPILGNIANPRVGEILQVLKEFYSNIKKTERFLRLVFITGVSKFSHVSLFSDLNNLTDITMNPNYAGMLGFTAAEVRECFADRIPEAAQANGETGEGVMKKLFAWYDGYRFSEAETHVCNPVSITKFFANAFRFSNFWDSTGTPSFLLELMRKQSYDHEAALNDWYDESIFSAYELDSLDITGLLWQTGYLTIKEIRQEITGIQYRLDFPDQEVKQTFMTRLLEYYASVEKGLTLSLIGTLIRAMQNDDLGGFLTCFQSVLANIDYKLHIPDEKYYQSIFYVVFKLLGIWIEAESCTNEGRIDAYIRTARAVYVFEFKLNKTAKRAVGQIIDRRYYERFQGSGLPVRLIGVNFDSSKGRIDGWKEKPAPAK